MSLEDAVNRAAVALERNSNAAVAEIIRQRDEALKFRDQCKHDAEFWKKQCLYYQDKKRSLERKNSALRGVITRLKKAKNGGGK